MACTGVAAMLNGHQAPGAVNSLEMQATPNLMSGKHWSPPPKPPKGPTSQSPGCRSAPAYASAHTASIASSASASAAAASLRRTQKGQASSIIGLMPASSTVISTSARRNTESTTK